MFFFIRANVLKKIFGYMSFDILIKMMPFFILPYLAHSLTTSDFKSISFYIVMLSFFLTLLPLGVSTKVLLVLTENKNNKLELFSAIIPSFSFFLIFLVVSLLFEGCSEFLSKELTFLLMIGFNLSLGQVIAARFQAEQKSLIYGAIMFSLQASIYLPLLYYISFSESLVDIEEAFFISLIVQLIIIGGVLYSENKSLSNRINFRIDNAYIYFSFVLSIIIHVLVNSIRFIYDRLFLASAADDSSFVFYNVAMQVAMILSVFIVSGNRFWTSYFFSNKDIINKKHYTVCFVILLLLAVFVYFFGILYISIFYPPDFYESILIMPVLLLSFIFQGGYLIFSVQLYANNNIRVINVTSILSLLISLIVMQPLFNMYGSYGVAFSVLIAWASLFFFSIIFNKVIRGSGNQSVKV